MRHRATTVALLLALAVLFVLVGAGPASAAEAPDPARELLARAKQAAGGAAWDAVRILRTTAKVETGGLSGTAESWEDAVAGRWTESFRLGPVTGGGGFDGESAWSRDASGQVTIDSGGEGRATAANEAYRRSFSWWFPERRAGSVKLAGERADGDRRFLVVEIRPEGGRPFELWLDAETLLADRTVEDTGREVRTVLLSDYREVGGVKLPHRSRATNGDARFDVVVEVERIEVNPAVDAARFAVPEAKVADFAILGGATSTTVPFRFLNQHLYVDVAIDGNGPIPVLLDTGGLNALTRSTAERLGLRSEGRVEGRGVGEKSEVVSFTKIGELRLGDAVLRDQVFWIFPLEALEAVEGTPVGGIIGFEVFKRLVARIDYVGRTVTFTLPEAAPEPRGTIVPITFDEQTPQVEGAVDGIPGVFSIDTGSRGSLALNTPFVAKHGLAAKYAPKVEAVTGWGVGGGVRSRVARAGVLRLGSAERIEMAKPVTELVLSEKGSLASPYLAGNVGNGVLRRFTLTIDYPKSRLVFEPNAEHGRPDPFDRAGLWLNRAAEGFEVLDLVAGGPAAEAGLQVRDVITMVDGLPAVGIVLSDLRDRLRGSPEGTKVRLMVRRGDGEREVVVTLRELL